MSAALYQATGKRKEIRKKRKKIEREKDTQNKKIPALARAGLENGSNGA